MGLYERRKIKEYHETIVPERMQELAEITGSRIPYDIDWESFADDLEGLNYLDNLSFHRINMALRVICCDDLGKEAIQDGLQVIRLRNVREKREMHLSFADRVLDMSLVYARGTDGMFSDAEIRNALVKGL